MHVWIDTEFDEFTMTTWFCLKLSAA